MNTLREALPQYMALRRHLGFKLREAESVLLQFVSFMEQHCARYITSHLALLWAQQPREVNPARWARRLAWVRGFARYRSAFDPRTQIPPTHLLPHQPKRARPYLYSPQEIARLLRAARALPPAGSLRPWTYYCLIGLLSVSGLRFGEARDLQLQDIDFEAAILTIRRGKFGKSRLVPLHASTCKVLRRYIARRAHFFADHCPSPYLFVTLRGNRLSESESHRTFRILIHQAGLSSASHGSRPRLHDFRHRFATHTLLRWYRVGEDPERRLPILSTYLGHVRVSDTYWYLNNEPHLMREAMLRLERRWERRS
jgi:integrase/recombinase XerD